MSCRYCSRMRSRLTRGHCKGHDVGRGLHCNNMQPHLINGGQHSTALRSAQLKLFGGEDLGNGLQHKGYSVAPCRAVFCSMLLPVATELRSQMNRIGCWIGGLDQAVHLWKW